MCKQCLRALERARIRFLDTVARQSRNVSIHQRGASAVSLISSEEFDKAEEPRRLKAKTANEEKMIWRPVGVSGSAMGLIWQAQYFGGLDLRRNALAEG